MVASEARIPPLILHCIPSLVLIFIRLFDFVPWPVYSCTTITVEVYRDGSGKTL